MRRLFLALAAAVLGLTLAAPAAAAPPGPPPGQPDSRFVEMFPQLPGFTAPTDTQLIALAQTMLDPNADSENNPDMTSVFTYFGQFVDHDLTLDIEPSPTGPVNPRTVAPNSRTFRLDLDSVYGGGPTGSPQLYEADGKHFRVQAPNPNGVIDLPREANGRAVLVEGRNDENQILSQIHVAWLRVHNRLVDSGLSYADARARTVQLYQHLVLTEFLPHIVGQGTVDQTRNGTLTRHYKPANPTANATPIEFSVAAYRFGHSQVRRAYRLNGDGLGVNIQVFDLNPAVPDLRGGRQLGADRQIDWGRFVTELTGPNVDPAGVNVSRKIDPLISRSLFQLPIPGAADSGSNLLAFRNLVRADAYGMASGQDVARAMGVTPITPEQLNLGPGFETGTPLWFYILAEASRAADGKTLGPVGGRIVADVFVTLLEQDPASVLNRPFTPAAPEAATPGEFDFADLFVFAGLAQRR